MEALMNAIGLVLGLSTLHAVFVYKRINVEPKPSNEALKTPQFRVCSPSFFPEAWEGTEPSSTPKAKAGSFRSFRRSL